MFERELIYRWEQDKLDRISWAADKKAHRPYSWVGNITVKNKTYKIGILIIDGEFCWDILTPKGNPSVTEERKLTMQRFNEIDAAARDMWAKGD